MGIILFLAVSVNLPLLVFILPSGALVTGLSPWSPPHNSSIPDSSLFLSLPLQRATYYPYPFALGSAPGVKVPLKAWLLEGEKHHLSFMLLDCSPENVLIKPQRVRQTHRLPCPECLHSIMHLRPTFRILEAVSPTLVAVGYSQLNTGSSFSSALNKDNKNDCYVKAGK